MARHLQVFANDCAGMGRFHRRNFGLNPVEHIWDDLREKAFHNRVFESIDGLEHHLEVSLRELEQDTERVRSIVAWPWIIKALMN
jgi:hypothetical protein